MLAFCLEHLTQSLQLDSPSLSSLYFLSLLLLDFYLGSCGIKSSYVKIIHFSDPHAGGPAEDWMAYFDKRWVGVFNYRFRRRFR